MFELKLPFPDVNYTSAMALTHSLFLLNKTTRTLTHQTLFSISPLVDSPTTVTYYVTLTLASTSPRS
ncbi:hypothetical protein CARUB_v10003924mg [Capsella rubella]|uniref:Uncharacterized protein n=1 Tax=Capsella rubella TaxID=81985 RepID=R0FCE4_9BRAS|nr:hypothetical protein CARUB_v10003924mg [Capsella rubella]